ncbi:hypothetical protein [Puniceibacterium sediminis]|nr:hypothetical protein [Puniceibacterium sediminis]
MSNPGQSDEFDRMKDELRALERAYEANGIIDWDAYAHGGRDVERVVVEVRAKDFRNGTLRLTRPCCLRFTEDVIVNPNRPSMCKGEDQRETGIDPDRDLDWWPDLSDPDQIALYGAEGSEIGSAYQLGFFAAIAVETTGGTIIDLNDYHLAMQSEFALQQRFFALIELADQPFVFSQGPSAAARGFGRNLRPARQVMIKNGTLGRSAHHAIHGNNPSEVVLSNLTFRDYEVAAIAINGPRHLLIEDCVLQGNSAEVPVLGTYSAGRFALVAARRLLQMPDALDPAALAKLQRASADLAADMDAVFDHVIFGKPIDKSRQAAAALFLNPTGHVDGNAYGIAVHSRGMLAGPFVCRDVSFADGLNDNKDIDACKVRIVHTSIADTRASVREIVALGPVTAPDTPPAPHLVDAAGAVLPFFPTGDQPGIMDDQGRPALTSLAVLQFAIAEAVAGLPLDQRPPFPRRTISETIRHWASDGNQRLVPSDETPGVWQIGIAKPERFQVRCNGDSMHHVNKGVIALFIQAVSDLDLDNLLISNTVNAGAAGSALAGPYTSGQDGGHAGQAKQIGYTGAGARGAYIGACTDVRVRALRVMGVQSHWGNATGIELAGGTECADLTGCGSGQVQAGTRIIEQRQTAMPNGAAVATTLRIAPDTRLVKVSGFHDAGGVVQPGPLVASGITILSPDCCFVPQGRF